MWLMTPFGFFSIVCAKDEKGGPHTILRMIRARNKAHLVALRTRHPHLPEIKTSQNTDYPYRIICDAGFVYQIVTALTDGLDYTNFKAAAKAASPTDDAYTHFLHRVWAEGLHLTSPRVVKDVVRDATGWGVPVYPISKARPVPDDLPIGKPSRRDVCEDWAVLKRNGTVVDIRGKYKTRRAAMGAAHRQKLKGRVFNLAE